jgi:glycosyltransferase involved in cell wall biosynthesis
MKILHLLYESKGDYFGIGGVGIRAYEIYGRLKDRHDITLLCKKYPGAVDGYKEGLKHVFVGTESRGLTKTLLSYAWQALLFARKYGKEYDIIIEEFSPGIPTFLHFFPGRPLVLQIQGYTGMKYFEKYNIFYSCMLYLFERLRPLWYRNIIVVSDYTIGRYHLDERKINIEVIPNGISENLLSHEPEETDYILYLGRIDIHHKGLDILLQAYGEFCNAVAGIRLVIAGDGRDRDKFAGLIAEYPETIRQNIEIRGWVHGGEKADLLRNALMVVMPSRYETQGIVSLEAMASGKAIIVSDIPELSNITSNGAGLSFKTGDTLSLTQAMKDLLASNERGEMGQRGRDWVKSYTWDNMAFKYEKYLQQVVAMHRFQST